jgi:hypothetical protein
MDKHLIFQWLSAAVLILFLLLMKTLPDRQRVSPANTVYRSANIPSTAQSELRP